MFAAQYIGISAYFLCLKSIPYSLEIYKREGYGSHIGGKHSSNTIERPQTIHTNIKLSKMLRNVQFSGHFRTVHFFDTPCRDLAIML
jgi:hypothetical protein